MPLIDHAVYVDGRRVPDLPLLTDTFRMRRERGGMAWIGLYRPGAEEIQEIADEFDLHPLAVEDALTGHQRSKLERYGQTLFVVLRPARYRDDTEEVEFGELHLFVGADFVVTVRHAETPDLARVRRRLEGEPALLSRGGEAVLYAILDEVVDEYGPVIAGLQNDVDEIEDELFDSRDEDGERLLKRIYDLSREVVDFQRATAPLVEMLGSLLRGAPKYHADAELQRHLRDALDHAVRVVDRAGAFRTLLENAIAVQATLVAQRQNDAMRRMTEFNIGQNEEIKKISSWAAILFAPTLVGTVYGMNFEHMPELQWEYGYPLAVAAMLGLGAVLFGIFKYKKWL